MYLRNTVHNTVHPLLRKQSYYNSCLIFGILAVISYEDIIITINDVEGLRKNNETELAPIMTLSHCSFVTVIKRLIVSSISCIHSVMILQSSV